MEAAASSMVIPAAGLPTAKTAAGLREAIQGAGWPKATVKMPAGMVRRVESLAQGSVPKATPPLFVR
jgi:hypothetical protein